jgi:hypothetical protein
MCGKRLDQGKGLMASSAIAVIRFHFGFPMKGSICVVSWNSEPGVHWSASPPRGRELSEESPLPEGGQLTCLVG